MKNAVIFDLDGVITDTAVYHYLAWKQIANKLDIQFDEKYNEKLKGVSRLESLNLLLDINNSRNKYSDEEKKKLTDEKNEIYKELIKQITPDDLLPGMDSLLPALKQAGILTGLASVSRNAGTIIKNLNVEEYFDYMADITKVNRGKPYPDIFLDCADNLKVQPSECIGVEDAKVGIEAIHRAGMRAIGVGSADQMQEADIILPGTDALTMKVITDIIQS